MTDNNSSYSGSRLSWHTKW